MIVVGLVAGLMTVVFALSFGSLVYSGELARFLPLGSAVLLAGTMVMNLIGARLSSLTGSILIPQDTTTALVAVTLGLAMTGVAAGSQLATALAILAAGALATGAVMLGLGWWKAGDLVRFVPVPVMGGFLAGTGWILVVGAADLTTAGFDLTPLSVANFGAAVVIGLVLTFAARSGRRAVTVFPAIVLGSVALFYVVLAVTGTSITDARALGLLPEATGALALGDISLGSVDWGAVTASIPRLLVITVVASLGLLMNVGGLELVARRDADLDRELVTAGLANVAAAVAGPPSAYHTLGLSALGYRLDLHSRAIPVIAAGACGVAAVVGPGIVSGLPLMVVGGALLMVGFGFLIDWLLNARARMPLAEYVLMLAIVVVIAAFGFMPGVLFGMAAAIVLFTVKYSRLDPIRHSFTGAERTSSIDRGPGEQRILMQSAGRVLVAELQGFLFFGTAHKAVKVLEARLRADDLRCLVVDLRRVEGFDSTAVFSFARLEQTASEMEVALIFSDTSDRLRTALEEPGTTAISFAQDLDQALEWFEDRLLAEATPSADDHIHLLDDTMWARLERLMDRLDLAENDILADVGEDSDCVFVVQSGRIAVELPIDAGRWQRVRSVGQGNLLGEFSLYVDGGRSARLRAETPSAVLRLSPQAVAELEATDPTCAIAFHRAVAQLMAQRLTATNEFVQTLVR